MTFGWIVVVVGVLLLLQNLGFITSVMWSLVWPCLIIAAGVSIIMRHQERERKYLRRAQDDKEKKEED